MERNGRIERYGKSFTSAEKLEDVIQQIVGRCNRVVNEQNPIVDARLENGDSSKLQFLSVKNLAEP